MEDKKRRYWSTAVKSWDNPAKAVRLESNTLKVYLMRLTISFKVWRLKIEFVITLF